MPHTSLCAITVFVFPLLLAADWIKLGQAGASPYLKAPGGDSVDRQHSRHESRSTAKRLEIALQIIEWTMLQIKIILLVENSQRFC